MLLSLNHCKLRLTRRCLRIIIVALACCLIYTVFNFHSDNNSTKNCNDADSSSNVIQVQDVQELQQQSTEIVITETEIVSNPFLSFEIPDLNKKDEEPSVKDLILEAADTVQNIPLPPTFLLGASRVGPSHLTTTTCARFPSILDIEFNNLYWQTLQTSNGTLYLYGAYWDVRKQNHVRPTIRILGMMDRLQPNVTSFCQIWFSKRKRPVISKVIDYNYIWFSEWGNQETEDGLLQPYLLSCQVPKKYRGKVPLSVSIVENSCDFATNNLRIIFDKPKKKMGFAVCVKGMDFPYQDLSVRLIEWIELIRLLGADQIFLYEFTVHPNIKKVLKYYEEEGQIDVTQLTLPGGQPNEPRIRHIYLKDQVTIKRQNELIPYNDCLYRNMYKYQYIALLDIDEVIIPTEVYNWEDLIDGLPINASRRPRISDYYFQHSYFMDDMMDMDLMEQKDDFLDIPKYMHMLKHVYRSSNRTGTPRSYAKCFHNPERVLTIHNHFPIACLNGACRSFRMLVTEGKLHHYRAGCVKDLSKKCEEVYRQKPVLDTTIWRYKDELARRVNITLHSLDFLGFHPGSD